MRFCFIILVFWIIPHLSADTEFKHTVKKGEFELNINSNKQSLKTGSILKLQISLIRPINSKHSFNPQRIVIKGCTKLDMEAAFPVLENKTNRVREDWIFIFSADLPGQAELDKYNFACEHQGKLEKLSLPELTLDIHSASIIKRFDYVDIESEIQINSAPQNKQPWGLVFSVIGAMFGFALIATFIYRHKNNPQQEVQFEEELHSENFISSKEWAQLEALISQDIKENHHDILLEYQTLRFGPYKSKQNFEALFHKIKSIQEKNFVS